MISWVFFAAMTPATMAVSKTGPFFVRWPVRASSRATAAGSLTIASAEASRDVALFSPTSTIVGRLRGVRCVSLFGRFTGLATDVVHLDLVQVGRVAQGGALLAVSVRPRRPDATDRLVHLVVARAAAQRRAQVDALGREQARVKGAVGRQPRARAVAAEWLRHGGDESELARA